VIPNVIHSAVQMPAAISHLTARTKGAVGLNMIPNVIHSAVQMPAAINHLTARTKRAVGLNMITNMIFGIGHQHENSRQARRCAHHRTTTHRRYSL
jgi:hypothetical protein